MMDLSLVEIAQQLLTLGLYLFLGWVFIQYILFLLRMVAPKVMTGQMDIRSYISLIGGGLMMLFLIAFGPYYVGQALLYGWNSFKPTIITISEDIVNDVNTIINGEREIHFEPVLPETQPIVSPVPIPPTTTPFDFNTWSPDQPVPTPEK